MLDLFCRDHNIDCDDAKEIRLGENALFEIPSSSLIVRIGRNAHKMSNARKEVEVAEWLQDLSFPAARLWTGDKGKQPFQVGGLPVTLWERISGRDGEPGDIATLANLLRRWHSLPDDRLKSVPPYAPLSAIEERLKSAEIRDSDKDFLFLRLRELQDALPSVKYVLAEGVIHGDAHIKNMMVAASGPVLLDFENVAYGQPEWDLAMTATEYKTAGWWTDEQYREFCLAYGWDVITWDGFQFLRQTHELKMTTWLMQNIHTSDQVAAEFKVRMEYMKTGCSARWSTF